MDIKYFYCAFCNYKTKRKYDLNRHQNGKHIKNMLIKTNEEIVNQKEENANQNEENVKQTIYQCKKCNKNYKTKKYLIDIVFNE